MLNLVTIITAAHYRRILLNMFTLIPCSWHLIFSVILVQHLAFSSNQVQGPCERDPCASGTCTPIKGEPSCRCEPGSVGSRCEMEQLLTESTSSRSTPTAVTRSGENDSSISAAACEKHSIMIAIIIIVTMAIL